MKKLLFLLSFTFGVSLYGQSADVITNYVASQRMVWSNSDEEWLFFDLRERHYERVLFEFELEQDGTGKVQMTNYEDGERYKIIIYKWEIRKGNDGDDYIWMDGSQAGDGQRCTIIVNNYSNGRMISIFMPDSKLAIFFDNLIN